MRAVKYVLPGWSLPYLINSDASGLSDEDIKKVDAFVSQQMDYNGYTTFIVTAPDGNSCFCWRNDVDNLGCDVCDVLVIVSD